MKTNKELIDRLQKLHNRMYGKPEKYSDEDTFLIQDAINAIPLQPSGDAVSVTEYVKALDHLHCCQSCMKRAWAICEGGQHALTLLMGQLPSTVSDGKDAASSYRVAKHAVAPTRCAANRDGECSHPLCPQLLDGEPAKSKRHCPIDIEDEEV
jgi:hypothetical protein